MLGAIFLKKIRYFCSNFNSFPPSLSFFRSNDAFKWLVIGFSRPNNWFPRTFVSINKAHGKTFVYSFIDTFSDCAEFSHLNNIVWLFNYKIKTQRIWRFYSTPSLCALSHYSSNIFVRLNATSIRMSLSTKSHNLHHATISTKHL